MATAPDGSSDITGQTLQTLNALEKSLIEMGPDKTRIVSAQIYLANMGDKPAMNKVWLDWLGHEPENWPQRACLGVELEGNYLVEVVVTAVRQQDG